MSLAAIFSDVGRLMGLLGKFGVFFTYPFRWVFISFVCSDWSFLVWGRGGGWWILKCKIHDADCFSLFLVGKAVYSSLFPLPFRFVSPGFWLAFSFLVSSRGLFSSEQF